MSVRPEAVASVRREAGVLRAGPGAVRREPAPSKAWVRVVTFNSSAIAGKPAARASALAAASGERPVAARAGAVVVALAAAVAAAAAEGGDDTTRSSRRPRVAGNLRSAF